VNRDTYPPFFVLCCHGAALSRRRLHCMRMRADIPFSMGALVNTKIRCKIQHRYRRIVGPVTFFHAVLSISRLIGMHGTDAWSTRTLLFADRLLLLLVSGRRCSLFFRITRERNCHAARVLFSSFSNFAFCTGLLYVCCKHRLEWDAKHLFWFNAFFCLHFKAADLLRIFEPASAGSSLRCTPGCVR
jgi:hypothetical protein